jgi:hypothetical protein
VPDPGAIIEVEESARPERWTPPAERKRRDAERAKRNRELRRRSEEHDRKLAQDQAERRIRAKQQRGEELSSLDKLLLKWLDQES